MGFYSLRHELTWKRNLIKGHLVGTLNRVVKYKNEPCLNAKDKQAIENLRLHLIYTLSHWEKFPPTVKEKWFTRNRALYNTDEPHKKLDEQRAFMFTHA